VLSNHDNPRHRTRYGGSEARARSAAFLLLLLRGTPFLYAGEELGLADADVPEAARSDPGGRDGCRAPIPWDATPQHGWRCARPWLPWPPEAESRSAASQRADSGSILHLYRRLLAARRTSPALCGGTFAWLPVDAEGVLAFERRHGNERRAVLVGFSDAPAQCRLPGRWRVVVSSDGEEEGRPFGGRLGPDRALLLAPDTP
jgi:alpha-glucosidase